MLGSRQHSLKHQVSLEELMDVGKRKWPTSPNLPDNFCVRRLNVSERVQISIAKFCWHEKFLAFEKANGENRF